jgi:hypothetical protein
VDEIDQRRRWPDGVLEVLGIGDDQLFKIDDVGDEDRVHQEERDDHDVEGAAPQRHASC